MLFNLRRLLFFWVKCRHSFCLFVCLFECCCFRLAAIMWTLLLYSVYCNFVYYKMKIVTKQQPQQQRPKYTFAETRAGKKLPLHLLTNAINYHLPLKTELRVLDRPLTSVHVYGHTLAFGNVLLLFLFLSSFNMIRVGVELMKYYRNRF